MIRKFVLFFFVVSTGLWASAQTDLRLEETQDSVHISVGATVSSVQSGLLTLNGAGPNAQVSKGIDDAHAFFLGLTSLYELQSRSSLYFSVFGGYEYALQGGFLDRSRKLMRFDGSVVATELIPRRHATSVGVGFEQMILNGKDSIYSGTGLTGKISREFTWRGYDLRGEARVLLMTVRASPMQVFGLSLSYGF